jgi:hypothetical protein
MLRALLFRQDNLELIAKESGAPIEDVESQWENIQKYGYPYFAVLGAQDWDGTEIPWIWVPEGDLRDKFEFAGIEAEGIFTEIVKK